MKVFEKMKRESILGEVINLVSKSTTGLKKESAAALAVLFAPTIVIPIVMFLLEKDSFVRFYAVQVLILGLSLFVLQWTMAITIILLPLVPLLTVLGFVLWLIQIYKAWTGSKWSIPYIGKITEQVMTKL